MQRENVVNEIKTQYGQVNLSEGTETVKTPGLAFRGGGVYIGLKVVQKYNERTGKIEKKPQLVAMQGDIYLDFPINGAWLGNETVTIEDLTDPTCSGAGGDLDDLLGGGSPKGDGEAGDPSHKGGGDPALSRSCRQTDAERTSCT